MSVLTDTSKSVTMDLGDLSQIRGSGFGRESLRWPVLEPLLHKLHHLPLRIRNGGWRELGRGLVRKQSVFIPMVHASLDQDERLACGRLPLRHARGVNPSAEPRIPLTINWVRCNPKLVIASLKKPQAQVKSYYRKLQPRGYTQGVEAAIERC